MKKLLNKLKFTYLLWTKYPYDVEVVSKIRQIPIEKGIMTKEGYPPRFFLEGIKLRYDTTQHSIKEGVHYFLDENQSYELIKIDSWHDGKSYEKTSK